jgi:hypothetical protein
MHPAIKNALMAVVPPLKRLILQRNELLSKLAMDISGERTTWMKHRPYATLNVEPTISTGVYVDDTHIVERLVRAYQGASNANYGKDSMWRKFFETYQKEYHNVFVRGDIMQAREILANPSKNSMFYGFDELCSDVVEKHNLNMNDFAMVIQDKLIRLAEAMGSLNLENPESSRWRNYLNVSTDEALRVIEADLGGIISFPNVYSGEIGSQSYRGLITYRTVLALYWAFRIQKTVRDSLSPSNHQPSICEIGGGLGRTALYAWQLGLKDYTLVDVPMTTISQGYYLMRCLGEDAVVLPGEQRRSREQIRLVHSEDFFASEERFDLIANMDSITEFGHETAIRYLKKVSVITPDFLSMNHEVNEIRVIDLLKEIGINYKASRHPSWIRNGYVEEFVNFQP